MKLKVAKKSIHHSVDAFFCRFCNYCNLFAGCAAESIAYGDGESAGDKIDIGQDIEFRFPVEGEVDGCVLEFIVHAYNACGAEPGLSVLEAYVTATAIEPFKAFIATDELVSFV